MSFLRPAGREKPPAPAHGRARESRRYSHCKHRRTTANPPGRQMQPPAPPAIGATPPTLRRWGHAPRRRLAKSARRFRRQWKEPPESAGQHASGLRPRWKIRRLRSGRSSVRCKRASHAIRPKRPAAEIVRGHTAAENAQSQTPASRRKRRESGKVPTAHARCFAKSVRRQSPSRRRPAIALSSPRKHALSSPARNPQTIFAPKPATIKSATWPRSMSAARQKCFDRRREVAPSCPLLTGGRRRHGAIQILSARPPQACRPNTNCAGQCPRRLPNGDGANSLRGCKWNQNPQSPTAPGRRLGRRRTIAKFRSAAHAGE